MKFILGSKSPGRRQILTKMGYEFTVLDPNIDEKSIRSDVPERLVSALACAKAMALLPKISEAAILITSDQVVRCNSKILEKPKDQNEAHEFLRMYMQYPAETITAVTVTNTLNKKQESGVDIAKIWFHPIPENMVEQIANQEYVITCAGGFSLDDLLLKKYIAKIEGAPDSITGLPIELTKQLILKVA
ncbi:Nucleoside triphosphate pyrophosphatase [Gammaproteobacteria bacterium]